MPVRIDLGQVGGPSAGLAFALDVVEELGHDVDRGHKVAASGELCLDGTVVSVGGLKQKTIGARRAGVDVFLVPAGENAEEARRYAGSMKVVPVQSFRQALRALATLPEKQHEILNFRQFHSCRKLLRFQLCVPLATFSDEPMIARLPRVAQTGAS